MDMNLVWEELNKVKNPIRAYIGNVVLENEKREKGCEYCSGDSLNNLILTNFCGKSRVALRGGNTPVNKEERPKFCPHCGKPLNWKEKR